MKVYNTDMKVLDHPEVYELVSNLLENLLGESDRGAVLIGTEHVNDHLGLLFTAILPKEMNRKKRDRVLNYPSPLSSFSARIDTAYALRLIPGYLHAALHALRNLRNDAAHSSKSFSLEGEKDRIKSVYHSLGEGMEEWIWVSATSWVLQNKSAAILHIRDEMAKELGEVDVEEWDAEQAQNYLLSNAEWKEAIRRQIPQWELVLGVAAICGIIVAIRERATALFREHETLWHIAIHVAGSDELSAGMLTPSFASPPETK